MELLDIEPTARFLYRFRPFSVLSQKELMYHELFFSKNSELNDPFDTQLNYVFGPEPAKYFRLIEQALGAELLNASQLNIEVPAARLGADTRSLGELFEVLASKQFKELLIGAIARGNLFVKQYLAESMSITLARYVHFYIDRFAYTCSFSYKCTNSTMWSHYADQHRGFAMIFLPFKNRIFGDPLRRDVHSVDAEGRVSYFDSQEPLRVERVRYSKEPVRIDAFMCITAYVYGSADSSEFQHEILRIWRKSATTKHLNWKYEQEARLVDYDAGIITPVTESGRSSKEAFERTRSFDPTQLVGLVFGCKMKESEKKTLRSLVLDSRGQTLLHAGVLPFFYFVDATSSEDSYDLKLKVSGTLDHYNSPVRVEAYKSRHEAFLALLPDLAKGKTKHQSLYSVYGSHV